MTVSSRESTPLVSAIVTTHDRPELCKRALKSVIAQTYEPLEVIVVEDGTRTGIDQWMESVIPDATYVRHEENEGLAAARNTGLSIANGEYIAYLDDDDLWKPSRISKQVTVVEMLPEARREELGVVYCGVERRSLDGEFVSIGRPENEGNLAESIRASGASTLPSTFLFVRDALESFGGFDESLSSSIDHDVWMALATHGYAAVAIDEPLVVSYLSHKDSMVTKTEQRIRGVEQYVEKWTPTYREWYGPESGEQYGKRYFARVIARLVGPKLISGDLTSAIVATVAIFRYSNLYWYNLRVVSYSILTSVVVCVLPHQLVNVLRDWKGMR